jgi:hypothetical protein
MTCRKTGLIVWNACWVLVLGAVGCTNAVCGGETELGGAVAWEGNRILPSSHLSVEETLKWPSPSTDVSAFDVIAEWADEAELALLPSETALRALVGRLVAQSDADESGLGTAWGEVAAALQAVRALAHPSPVRTVETCLESLEAALDAFCEKVGAYATGDRGTVVRLLARAGELERHADRLESVASRIRLYGKGGAAAALAGELEGAVRALADGDGDEYVKRLWRIAAAAEAARGGDLRRDAADSVRADCDALVRRLVAATVRQEASVACSVEAFGVVLDLELTGETTRRNAPSGGLRSVVASGVATYETDAAEFGGSFDVGGSRVDDRLREDSAEATSGVAASAAWHPGEVDIEAAISGERERFPHMIDAEIEESALRDVESVVVELAREVHNAGLPATTERRLLGDLDGVREALATGMRGDAADALEDFIDRVESERWKGAVTPEAAAWWTERATGVQPRRTVRRLAMPLRAEAPIGEGTASVDIEWSATDHPANSALSVAKSTGTATWSVERSGWRIDASAGRAESLYPAAPAKNAATSEFVLDLTRNANDLAFGAAAARYARPASPESEHEDTTLNGSLSWTWGGVAWILEASDEARRYPNRPSCPATRTVESELDVELALAGGSLGVTLASTTVRATDGDSGHDTTTLSIDWNHKAEGVDVCLSADWSRHTDWGDPGEDRETLLLSAELAIVF